MTTNLNQNETYNFNVIKQTILPDGVTRSVASSDIAVNILPGPTVNPQITSSERTYSTITIFWQAVNTNPSDIPISYEINIYDSSGTGLLYGPTSVNTDTEYTHNNLNDNTTYIFKVTKITSSSTEFISDPFSVNNILKYE